MASDDDGFIRRAKEEDGQCVSVGGLVGSMMPREQKCAACGYWSTTMSDAEAELETCGIHRERPLSKTRSLWTEQDLCDQMAEIKLLRERLALLENVVVAAALVANECDRPWSSGQRRLWTAVEALRKPLKRQDDDNGE